jgi:shikimate kinase
MKAQMPKNILLIGFMGVGKGTIAREISRQSTIFAIDSDDIIESLENRSIKKIFETDGEKYFRALEAKTAKWLEKSVKNSVISTGGGFYKVKNLKKIGHIVYLKSSFDAIFERILKHPNAKKKLAKRPLLKDLKKAQSLFYERVKEYENCADFTINVENREPKEIANEILKLF